MSVLCQETTSLLSDASQDLGVTPHNLTMVPGEAVLTEARGEKKGGGGGAPFTPRRTTRLQTRPQGV